MTKPQILNLEGEAVESFSVPDFRFLPFEILSTFVTWSEHFELDKGATLGEVENSVAYLMEEAMETDDAMEDFIENGTEENIAEKLDELIDGFADTAFVAINGIYKVYRYLGAPPSEAMALTVASLFELGRANNSKRQPDGSVKKDGLGKVLKPEDFQKPTYIPLITAAGEIGDILSAENRFLPSENQQGTSGDSI